MALNPGWVNGFVPTAQQWADAFSGKLDDLGAGYSVPLAGTTLTTDLGSGGWILEPVSELASLTVTAPVGTFDGQIFTVSTTKTIDVFRALAAGGQTLNGGGPFVLAENSAVTWKYRLVSNAWYRWSA